MAELLLVSLGAAALIALVLARRPAVPLPRPPPMDLPGARWAARLRALAVDARGAHLTFSQEDTPQAAFAGRVGRFPVQGTLLADEIGQVVLSLPGGVLPPRQRRADPDLPGSDPVLLPPSIQHAQRDCPGLQLHAQALSVSAPIDQLPALEALLGTLEALAEALLAPICTALRAAGLDVEPEGGAPLSAAGQVHDLPVKVALLDWGLEIRVRLPRQVPTIMQVMPRAAPDAFEGMWLPHPLLRRLIAARGDAMTREILTDPEVTGPLLAVLHTLPDSRIWRGEVRLCDPLWTPAAIPARLHDAVALARAIGDAAQRARTR